MESKKKLARTIVAGFHGEAAAVSADENWARMFQAGETAEDLEEVAVAFADVAGPEGTKQIRLPKLLVADGPRRERRGGQPQDRREGGARGWRVVESLLIPVGAAGAADGAARQTGEGCVDCVGTTRERQPRVLRLRPFAERTACAQDDRIHVRFALSHPKRTKRV